jgi:phospholipase A1
MTVKTISRAGAVATGLLAAFGLAASPLASQVPAEPASPQACAALVSDSERLACYDLAEGTAAPPTPEPIRSLLDSRWELEAASKLGAFTIRAYQPIYVLPWVGSTEVNDSPTEALDPSELEFQISWKTKAWQGVFGEVGDLWLAYTQSSRWQIYDGSNSRPFRESNYEPEILMVFATRYRVLGWDARLLSIGLDHESNGRDSPRSRSWNRVTAGVGLERGPWTLTVKPWWRVPEGAREDDNPDIEDHVGRAEILLVRHVRHHEFAAMLRHSLRGGDASRGALQLDWAFPIRGNLRAHAQFFHGYGESLIDYDFRTTRIGVGISLIEWY